MSASARLCILLLLVAGVFLGGCRLHLEYVEVGTPWPANAFESLLIGSSDRGDVLTALGPPDDVFYTLEYEILDYQVSGHRRTDLQFILPTSFIPGFALVANYRDLVDLFFPPVEDGDAFTEHSPGERGANVLMGLAQSFIPFSSTEDSLSLYGRRIRHDTLRIILSRSDLRLVQKELWLGIEVGRNESVIGSAFLSE